MYSKSQLSQWTLQTPVTYLYFNLVGTFLYKILGHWFKTYYGNLNAILTYLFVVLQSFFCVMKWKAFAWVIILIVVIIQDFLMILQYLFLLSKLRLDIHQLYLLLSYSLLRFKYLLQFKKNLILRTKSLDLFHVIRHLLYSTVVNDLSNRSVLNSNKAALMYSHLNTYPHSYYFVLKYKRNSESHLIW